MSINFKPIHLERVEKKKLLIFTFTMKNHVTLNSLTIQREELKIDTMYHDRDDYQSKKVKFFPNDTVTYVQRTWTKLLAQSNLWTMVTFVKGITRPLKTSDFPVGC